MFLKVVARYGGICLSVAATTVALSGCGTSSSAATPPAPDAQSQPKPTTRAALDALLSAEVAKNYAASFALLDAAARREVKDVGDWERLRSATPVITGYSVRAGSTDDQAVAEVTHDAGLDPFVGLSPAKERQTWRAAHVKGGWLLDAEPQVEPEYPSDSAASAAAVKWAQAVQRCDQQSAKTLQAVDKLFGTADNASKLCGSRGDIAPDAVQHVQDGPRVADLAAQYGSDTLQWARVVPLNAPVQFSIVLAPIGNEWKVVGLANNA